MSIIPFQSKFDKDFPVVIGNAEYNAECELIKAMDLVITTSGMEETFIKYAVDVGYANKAISLFGTGKSPRLTAKEIEAVRENAIFAPDIRKNKTNVRTQNLANDQYGFVTVELVVFINGTS